jgi:hypothetical protein
MDINYHGKKIAEIWLPGEGNAFETRMQSNQDQTLSLSFTHHGDRDEMWVVASIGGVESSRINVKQITEITWKQTP